MAAMMRALSSSLEGDTDLAQNRAREFREESFDDIEPRSVLRREDEGKAALALLIEPRDGFLRDVGGMVVEDDLDRGIGGIGAIQPLEKADELAGAVAILATGMNLPGQKIDAGKKTQRAVADIFIIARQARMFVGDWRQVLGRRRDRLDAGLLVIGHDRDVGRLRLACLRLACLRLACLRLACLRLACLRLACLGLACLGLACLGLACLGLACLGLACLGLACLGLACLGLACLGLGLGRDHDQPLVKNHVVARYARLRSPLLSRDYLVSSSTCSPRIAIAERSRHGEERNFLCLDIHAAFQHRSPCLQFMYSLDY